MSNSSSSKKTVNGGESSAPTQNGAIGNQETRDEGLSPIPIAKGHSAPILPLTPTTASIVRHSDTAPVVSVSKGNSHSVMAANYNQRNPAVRRLMREAQELASSDERADLHAEPLADNLFEWHFTFRGPRDTVFSNGIYHGRIILPSNYPMSPPEIAILTPNGRFQTSTKICLSISNHHPETWLPSWGIRTAVTALRAFMSTDSPGAIGSMQCSEAVRTQLAIDSLSYTCSECGPTARQLAISVPDQVATRTTFGSSGALEVETTAPLVEEPLMIPSFVAQPFPLIVAQKQFRGSQRSSIRDTYLPGEHNAQPFSEQESESQLQVQDSSSDSDVGAGDRLPQERLLNPEIQNALVDDLVGPRNFRARSRRGRSCPPPLSPGRRQSATSIRENLANEERRHAEQDPNYIPQGARFPPGQLEQHRRQAERRKRILFDVFVYLMASVTFIFFCKILYDRSS